MKAIIFDSSTLITLALNGLLSIIERISEITEIKLIITPQVKYESITRPINNIKQYELNGLQIQNLLLNGIIEMPNKIEIDETLLEKRTASLLKELNEAFYTEEEKMHLIHEGEASCLALSIMLSEKNIDNILAVDERTTRMMVENPLNLAKLLEKKLHQKIWFNNKIGFLNKIMIVRSSELIYLAYKKNLLSPNSMQMLDAALYAAKFKGSAISTEEIKEIKNLAKK